MTSEASAEHLIYIVTVWVFPAVCFISIVGNMVNIRVVVIHGLDKSYNVMLVCLAVADSTCMLSFFISGMFAQAACPHLYDNNSSFFHMYKLLQIPDYGGAWTSFLMPLFLTSERILAVWFPITYCKHLTARKTSVVMVTLYISVFFTIIYLTISTYNIDYLDMCDRSTNYTRNHSCFIDIAVFRNGIDKTPHNITYLSQIIFGPVPVSLVFCGCVVISVKVIMDSINRARMSSRRRKRIKDPSFRITLTLLAVCLLYGACSIFINVIHAGTPENVSCNTKEAVMAEVANIMALVNCSANPVIYVLLNPMFRKTMVKIFFHDCLQREWKFSVSRGSTSVRNTSMPVSERYSVRTSRNPSVPVSVLSLSDQMSRNVSVLDAEQTSLASPSSQRLIEPASLASINVLSVDNIEVSKSVTNN